MSNSTLRKTFGHIKSNLKQIPVLHCLIKGIKTVINKKVKIFSNKKKPPANMFNMYSSINKYNQQKEQKELETIGHDRFCQTRPSRASYRKKRRPMPARRTQSVAEFDATALATANKRHNLYTRSSSIEIDDALKKEERAPLIHNKFDSLAKLLFSKSTNIDKKVENGHTGRYQYSALDGAGVSTDRGELDKVSRQRALAACQLYLGGDGTYDPAGCVSDGRYEVLAHLDDIGSRVDKHWFIVHDGSVKTERLMTLVPVTPDCPIECTEATTEIIRELFSALQYPYIYPVLNLGFEGGYATLVMPFNPQGSLKDFIYKSQWQEPYRCKYSGRQMGLTLSQVQRLGRQILEALLFLQECGLPGHGHLHSGNVILQNGVARLSGLENSLLGLPPRVPIFPQNDHYDVADRHEMAGDVINFGLILFEMCAGYELTHPQPSAKHLQIDLERYPQVVDILQMIFQPMDGRCPTVQDLLLCDIFRNIDLREMRGSCVPHRLATPILEMLSAVRRRNIQLLGATSGGSSSRPHSPLTTRRFGSLHVLHQGGTLSEPGTPKRKALRRRHSLEVAVLRITDFSIYKEDELQINIVQSTCCPNVPPQITITLADSIVETV